MKWTFFALILTAFASLANVQQAQAQTTTYEALTEELVASACQDLGIGHEKIDDESYRLDFDGTKVLLFVSNTTCQLYCGFNWGKPDYEMINVWNAQKRFSRAYIDGDNDAVIEADFDLDGGVTAQNVVEFFRTFQNSVNAFQGHLGQYSE